MHKASDLVDNLTELPYTQEMMEAFRLLKSFQTTLNSTLVIE